MALSAEIKLPAAAALKDAYLELLPQFERATGHTVAAVWTSTPAVQKRIMAGEAADLVILGNSGTDELIKQRKLVPAGQILQKWALEWLYRSVRRSRTSARPTQ